MNEAFVEKIAPIFQRYQREARLATNDADTREMKRLLARYTDLLEAEIAAVIVAINALWEPRQLRAALYAFTDTVNEASRRYMLSAMLEQVGYIPQSYQQTVDNGVDEILDDSEDDALDYVPVIAREYQERIETGLLEALIGMATAAYVMSQLDEWADMAMRKSDFVAVNVTGELLHELDQQRAKNLDCEMFEWLTMKDDKVRDHHAVLLGKRFKWTEGAKGAGVDGQAIWPGTEFRCRCKAVPVFDE